MLREKKNKGNLELARERARLLQVKLLSPMSGLVAVRQNRTNFMFPGMQIPDIREGDQIQPGIPVADILDLSEMEIIAKVGELDRANLREGQEAEMTLDALPEKRLKATIKSMSGTASANVFSFDPAKKFDVVFNIDMRELLSALGAKPDAIAKILATAEQNRRKHVTSIPTSGPMEMGAAPGPDPAGGTPGMVMPGPGGAARETSPGGAPDAPRRQRNNNKSKEGKQGAPRETTAARDPNAPPGEDPASRRRGGDRGPAGMPPGFAGAFGTGPFTAKDLENAKLPPPPEEDTQFDVLLRPGLLADVQIIVEKIPNAINIPMQAVFEKDGKPVVYIKKGSLFEPRFIKPSKRSESVMTVLSGLTPGEVVALADPTAKKGDKKDKSGSSSGGAMSGLPGGKQ